jgi:membrane protease subunit (stomatin/prohibitin family)
MRTGRTMENDDLNVLAATGRGQQKSDASPHLQRRTSGMKTRSPSPARRPSQGNDGVQQQQQKGRTQIVSAAAKHCHECGEAFPVDWAKFCCECGKKRLGL